MSELTLSQNQPLVKPNTHFIFILSILILLMLPYSSNLMAQGDLLIFPKRVVFEGAQRFHELNLLNSGHDTARYVISFVQIRMKEDGGFENITQPDSGQNFADSFLRIFPRTVTLAPGEAQVVKIQLTKTNLLTEGEYRSHIYFRSDKKPQSLGEKDTTKDTTAIGIHLVAVYGITIPVIIRVGESTTNINISDLSFNKVNDSTAAVKLSINRKGNMSVYGDIKVDYISQDGKVTEVGKVQGVAVYTPNLIRRCVINLNNFPGINYNKGKLHLVYSAEREDRVSKLAEAELLLQ
ncbi:MAG: hypothetical protein WCA84_07135 [Ignavibacteriaceae bacterium]